MADLTQVLTEHIQLTDNEYHVIKFGYYIDLYIKRTRATMYSRVILDIWVEG